MFLPSHNASAERQKLSKSVWTYIQSLEIPRKVSKPKSTYNHSATAKAPKAPTASAASGTKTLKPLVLRTPKQSSHNP
jgi:hypothetical protein